MSMIALPEFESFTLSSDDKSDKVQTGFFLLIPKATQSKREGGCCCCMSSKRRSLRIYGKDNDLP